MNDPLGLFEEDSGNDPLGLFSEQPEPSLGKKALGVAETGIGMIAGLPSQIAGGLAGGSTALVHGIDEGRRVQEAVEKSNFGFGQYQPASETGKQYSEATSRALQKPVDWAGDIGEKIAGNEGRYIGELGMGSAMELIDPGVLYLGARGLARKAGKAPTGNKALDSLREQQAVREEAKTPPATQETIPNLKATEGEGGQMALFDIDEAGRMPNPYEAVTGDWRIDENGIPVKADLSMDAANAAQPLQRNLWGDELPQKHPQENARSIPEAIDTIPDTPFKGDAREIALNRLTGELPATPELLRARLEAESPFARVGRMKGQGGGLNVGAVEEFWKAKDRDRAVESNSTDLEALREDIARNGIKEPIVITVSTADGLGYVTDGNNRLTAARQLGLEKIPYRIETTNVPFTREQRAKAKSINALGITDKELVAPKKSKQALEAEAWLKEFNQSGAVPKSQRGGVYFGKKEVTQLENAMAKSSDGTLIPENPKANEVIQKAIEEGKDGKLWTYTQSGATSAAMKTGSAIIKASGEIVQNALKRSEKAIRDHVFPTEKALRKLPPKDLETLAQVFKDEMFNGRRFDADLLQETLTTKQLEAYTAVRDMFDDTLAAQNTARTAKGLPPVTAKESYMSSRWQGDFRRPVYDKQGKLVWYLAANSKFGLEAQTKALKAKFPDLMTDPKKDHVVKSSTGKTDLQSMYSTMLDVLGRNDPAIERIKAAIEEQTVAEAETVAAQTKHFENKANIRGFVGDRPGKSGVKESLAMFQEQIQYAKNAYRWSEMQKAADDLKPILSNETLQEQQPNNIKYVREYFKNAIGHGEAKAIRSLEDSVREGLGVSPKVLNEAVGNVKSFFILQKLGASAGYTAANIIQSSNVLPYLMDLRAQGYKGNPATAMAVGVPAGLAMTLAHYTKSIGGEYLSKVNDKFLKDAFQYAEDNGVTSRSIYDEGPLSGSFSGVGRVAELMGKTMTAPEVFVRSTAFMTYAKMLKDSGKFTDDSKMFQKAEDLVNKSMVDYRETERPLAFSKLGGAGNFLNTLQTFPMSFYNQYAYMAGQAIKGSVVPLVSMLALHYALAGTMGIPYSDDLYKLYMNIKDNLVPTSAWEKMQKAPFLSDPKLWSIETLGKSSVYGYLSEETGLGLTSRIAAPGLGSMAQSPVGPITDIAGQVGAVGSALMDPTNSTKWSQAAMKTVPTGLQGLLETSGLMKDHTFVQTPDGKIIAQKTSDLAARKGSYERTPEEVTARKWGLRSQKEVVERDVTYSTQRADQARRERSGALVQDYYDAVRRGDLKRAGELNALYTRLTGAPEGISNEQTEKQIMEEFVTEKNRLLMKEKTSPGAMLEAARMKKILDQELLK